jgi:hypothetical protein
MKRPIFSATLCLLAAVASVDAAIVVPGANGTDGALNITQDTVIDLSRAVTGSWDQDNTANAGNGVYDANKWAVVFKYTSVNVLAGKKLTFKNHATRAPVVWLVSGNVSISGTVELNGESGAEWGPEDGPVYNPLQRPRGGRLSEPGPGGFRGGAAWLGSDNVYSAAGFGPGGGRTGPWNGNPYHGTAAGFGTDASRVDWWGEPGKAYGNPALLPLIGGSGGGGCKHGTEGFPGGGGGGAILIACANSFVLNGGRILANGGDAMESAPQHGIRNGAGSGGGIRLVCASMVGSGSLSAVGGRNGWSVAGNGRIRLERVSSSNTINVVPAPSSLDLTDGALALTWPPANAPKATVVSVNSVAVTSDPKASFGASTPDASLPLVSSAEVIIETENVEESSQVVVRITPRIGLVRNVRDSNGNQQARTLADATEVVAVVKEVLSASPLKIRWRATVPTLPGYSAIQARVIRP